MGGAIIFAVHGELVDCRKYLLFDPRSLSRSPAALQSALQAPSAGGRCCRGHEARTETGQAGANIVIPINSKVLKIFPKQFFLSLLEHIIL